MNGLFGYFFSQVLPALGALFFTTYLAYFVINPSRLKVKMSKYNGTPKYDLYRKFYNKQFLGVWICVTLFFVVGIAYDLYKSTHAPSTVAAYLNLILILALIFVGGALMSRALKK